MVTKSQFASSSTIYAIGNAVNSLLAFFLIPLYLRNLTIEEYGAYGMLLIVIQIVSRFANLGLDSSMLRSSFDYESKRQKGFVYTTTAVLMGVLLLIVCSLFGFFSKTISELLLSTSDYSQLLLLALLIGAGRALRKIPQTILRIEERATTYILLEIVNFIIGVSLLIYLVEYKSLGLSGLLIGTAISTAINVFLFVAFTSTSFSLGFIKEEIMKQIRFGLPLVPAAASSVLFLSSGRFLLQHFSTLESVGLFTLAIQLSNMLETFFGRPIKLSWQPYFLKNYKKEGMSKQFGQITSFVAIFSISIALLMAYSSHPLLSLMAETKYLEALVYIPPLLIMYAFWTIIPVYNCGVIVTRKTKFIMYNFIFGAILNVILGYILIPILDIWGAVLSQFISFSCMFISIQCYNKKLGYNYVDWSRHWLIYFLGACFILSAILFLGESTWLKIFVKVGLFGMFIGLISFLGLLPIKYRKISLIR